MPAHTSTALVPGAALTVWRRPADGGHDGFGEGGQVGPGLGGGQVAEGQGGLDVVDRRLPDPLDEQIADGFSAEPTRELPLAMVRSVS